MKNFKIVLCFSFLLVIATHVFALHGNAYSKIKKDVSFEQTSVSNDSVVIVNSIAIESYITYCVCDEQVSLTSVINGLSFGSTAILVDPIPNLIYPDRVDVEPCFAYKSPFVNKDYIWKYSIRYHC